MERSNVVMFNPAEEMVCVALTHFARQDGGPQPSGRLASWLNTRDGSTITWTASKVGAQLRHLRVKGHVVAIDAATLEEVELVKPGSRVLWKLIDTPQQARSPRIVNVYLTKQVCAYLAKDGTDLVIHAVDDAGGLVIENAENFGAEGSGVWVDAVGVEHYGPGGSFVEFEPDVQTVLEMAMADARGED